MNSVNSSININETLEETVKLLEQKAERLRQHQIDGIRRMLEWANDDHGGILADEMGLEQKANKTKKKTGLVVCPLSVLDHWEAEFKRFGCGKVNAFRYYGSQDERVDLRAKLMREKDQWNVLLMPYHTFLSDAIYFNKNAFDAVILDEAHKVKNDSSLIHLAFAEHAQCKYMLLMTGTPVQNNLAEFYALLQVINPSIFQQRGLNDFLERFADLSTEEAKEDMKDLLDKYVLRRTKAEVCIDVPESSNVVLYHHITNHQRELYLNLVKTQYYEIANSVSDKFNKNRLSSVMTNLRKCVIHPYMFEGIEPEPFEEGEHLVDASGKFVILDTLLSYLQRHAHRALIYSQFTSALDICEDYMRLRKHSYYRLDGDTKAEDRFTQVNKFQQQKVDFFLLSTRAGGVGLTLTAADTVIFLDTDFNPQNDVQAAARCHRIGQTKPVKIIRLLAKGSIEDIIHYRAMEKLKLTERFFDGEEGMKLSRVELNELIMKSIVHLDNAAREDQTYSEHDIEKYIGRTVNGLWELPKDQEDLDKTTDFTTDNADLEGKSIYHFEGENYQMTQSEKKLLDDLTTIDKVYKTLSARNESSKMDYTQMLRKERERKEQAKKEREEKRFKAQQEEWAKQGYQSTNINIITPPSSPAASSSNVRPQYVYGDASKPQCVPEDKAASVLILHSVDNGGTYGKGGLFSVLAKKSPRIVEVYENAGEMNDLQIGSAHLIKNVTYTENDEDSDNSGSSTASHDLRKESVVLMVTQTLRERQQKLMRSSNVKKCFARISSYALASNAKSVHMANFWHETQNLQKDKVHEAIVEHFTSLGIFAYVYTFAKNHRGFAMKQLGRPKKRVNEGSDSDGKDLNNKVARTSD
ncbi:hypothetical protein QR680_000167 [Steinernema hermaphroditum]|uniref:Helicase ATP-binding domain-containing protein n=1 Tax=Steinernema hermaphroditum TaxID=289476 RepID=A0AA39GUI5_9BILA|nr:hypothetical protein QR680_000167 [Steinernema hermaphroditum]